MRRHFLLMVLILSPTVSFSAGFDCTKAGTKVEELICQNKALSRLDEKLFESYEQALARTYDASKLREDQRRWLRDERNRCSDLICLESAYRLRIDKLSTVGRWMTNEKEQAICKTVVDAVNDGSIITRIKTFEPASEDDKNTWEDNRSGIFLLYLYRTLKINAHSKKVTLGLAQGGGTCRNCEIEDINAIVTEVYPPDDSEEHLRWKGWGQCDHFLFIEGEPVIVTGNFGWGLSVASFVSWLAPDGAKRALCYLERDTEKEPSKKITLSNNPELCDAVIKNKIDAIPWSISLSIPKEDTGNDATMWDSNRDVALDINLDGKKETIVLFDHASGSGCGSYRQWLREFTPDQQFVFPLQTQPFVETPLNRIFSNGVYGPIKSTEKGDNWHDVKLFLYRGKPYILGQGTNTSAEVISVWGNQKKTWCEYQIFPQHQIGLLYPVETWPALTLSAFDQIKGGRALRNAAVRNNLEKARSLIRSGTPVDVIDDAGETPLCLAISHGHANMVKLLLESGASINGIPGCQKTPLMAATTANNVEIVAFLLNQKANPNMRLPSGATALKLAREREKQFNHDPKSAKAKKNNRIIELLLKAGATE